MNMHATASSGIDTPSPASRGRVFPTQTPHPRSRTIWDSGPNTSMITPYSQERIGQIKKIDRFRLTKLLYGLKQAGRRLQEELHEHPRAHGFERLPSDKCLFKVTKKRSDLDKSYSGEEVETSIIGLYVDDTQRSRLYFPTARNDVGEKTLLGSSHGTTTTTTERSTTSRRPIDCSC